MNTPESVNNRLAELRAQIDDLDARALAILNERMELVIVLGKLKKSAGLRLFDSEREKAIFRKLVAENPGPMSAAAVTRIFERIIDESRHIERVDAYEKE